MTNKDPRYEIENEEIKQLLYALAETINRITPPGWGFTIMLFEYEAEAFFWLSSADRKDMIKALREFIQREEGN